MPALTGKDVFKVGKRAGIHLKEYKGKFTVVQTREGEGDVHYLDWVFLSQWKNGEHVPDEKKRPMGIWLGDEDTALEALRDIIKQIQVMRMEPHADNEDDYPF
jgi:hypothetical protein